MDFSQVKAITIPEGSVNRILSGTTVLWEKMGGLPSAYQEVEYIEGTGTQYIDLPFGFDDTDTIEARFSIDTSMGSDKYVNSPKTWNNKNNRFGMGVHLASVAGYCVGFGSRATNSTFLSPRTQNDGEFHTWTYSNREFSISELGCSLNVSNVTFGGTTANLRLFYGYNAPTKCRIASYHHVKTGAKYDLVPCYRKSDSVAGLYDIVNNVFYTNAGTGVFTVGPEIISLPSGYQRVEYITATEQQYIDTYVIPNSNMRIVASGITGSSVVNAGFLFGSRTNTSIARFWILTWQSYYKLGLGSSHNANVIRASTNEDFTFDFNHNANHAVTVNETTVGSVTIDDGINYLYSIYVFGLNEKNSLNYQKTPCSFKRFTIYNSYEDTEPSMDLIPCYRIADGEIGMYDLVSATFFTNSGSGTFSKGADVG